MARIETGSAFLQNPDVDQGYQLLDVYKDRLRAFKISQRLNNNRKEDTKYGRGSLFTYNTHSQGQWQIFSHDDFLTQKIPLFRDERFSTIGEIEEVAEDVINELLKRQTLRNQLLSSQESNPHTRTIDFLVANWQAVLKLLAPSFHYHEDPPLERTRFVEVDLDGHGFADFIGIGPNNLVYLVEVGTTGKEKQLNSYNVLLHTLITSLNGNVIPVKAYYSENNVKGEKIMKVLLVPLGVSANTKPLANGDRPQLLHQGTLFLP